MFAHLSNESMLENLLVYFTLATRLLSWMFVRDRVLDEACLVQAQAFFSLVQFVVGPSAESRPGHDSAMGVVFYRICIASSPEQDAPSGELHKEGNVS